MILFLFFSHQAFIAPVQNPNAEYIQAGKGAYADNHPVPPAFQYCCVLTIPGHEMGGIIGKKGYMIQRIQSESNTHIEADKSKNMERWIKISGPDPPSVEAAKRIVFFF